MMKKIFSFFTLSLLLCGNIAITPAFAQEKECDTVFCGPGLEGGNDLLKDELDGTGIVSEGTLIQTILFFIRILLVFAGVFAFVAFVWAGFLYITTFASEDNSEKAKKIMLYAAIGIIVILMSYVLTDFFINATV